MVGDDLRVVAANR